MISFKELVAQITLGSNPVENNITTDKWNQFEEQIHIKIPADYIQFINLYGTGKLCKLVWVLNPFSEYDRFNLLLFLKSQREVFNKLQEQYKIKYLYKLFDNLNGILPFAFTDNGDTIYWNIKDENKKNYPIVILDGRNMSSEEHDLSFNEFINEVLNKSLNSLILIDEDIKTKRFDPLNKHDFDIIIK